MFVNNFSHILRAHISKKKRCFNVKSPTSYFQMKTKILAGFQICISVPLNLFNIFHHNCSNIVHSQIRVTPCSTYLLNNKNTGNTWKNTVIFPNFLVLKFRGKEQFPHSFSRFFCSVIIRVS